jgi:deoxyribonuclease V
MPQAGSGIFKTWKPASARTVACRRRGRALPELRRRPGGRRPGRRCGLRARAGRAHRAGPRAAPYRPGEFYLRELPPLRAVLADLDDLGLLVADGYADLDPGGRPGLDARAHAEFGIPVIEVAKSPLRTATHAVPVPHRSPARPLLVTAAGMPAADRRTWSGTCPAGIGCPTPLRRIDTLARTGPPQPP